MNPQKKILFIINPIAGTKAKGSIPELIGNYIDQQAFFYEIALTEGKGHAKSLAQEALSEGFDLVVAVGGDGTVSEVAAALIHESTVMGILPLGSGNGLARHLKIPLDTIEAIKSINNHNLVTIDAGVINNKPFFCTAGVGFDAHISRVFSERSARGFSTYVKLSLREFLAYCPRTYTIETAAETIKMEAFTLTLANAAQYGNEAYISPRADIQDGRLDLCIMRPFPKYMAMNLGFRLFTKTIHKSPYVSIVPIDSARITLSDVDSLHMDGEHEHLDQLTLSIETLPACLNILIPQQK